MEKSYLESGNIQVALYDDRLEITSPGCLDAELTIEDIKKGRSKLRNRGIAHVFRYMDIIETWGSGIPKLYKDAKAYGLNEPELMEIGNAFRVNLFRKTFQTDEFGVINPEDVVEKLTAPKRKEIILCNMIKNNHITAEELSISMNVSHRTVQRDIDKLKLENRIHREGSDTDGKWVVDIPFI